MGQVADGFASAFADNDANGNPLSPQKPAIRALGAAIEQQVSAEISRAEAAEQSLSAAVGTKATASDLASLATAVSAKAAASDLAAVAARIDAKAAASDLTALATTVSAKAAQSDLAAEVDRAQVAERTNATAIGTKAAASDLAAEVSRARAAEAMLLFSARPGDSPLRFSSQTVGRTPPADAAGATQQSALGPAYVLPAGATIAPRDAVWLEPNAFFAVRVVYQRLANPTPPGNAPLLIGVQWLDAIYAGISFDTIRAVPFAVADGLQVVTNRVPSASLDLATLVPPSGACFFRPFVRDLSRDGATLVHAMTISDVTNAGVYAPDVSRLASRVLALESRLSQFGG